MSKAATQSKVQVFLDELDLNVTGPIIAMICRKWDANAVTGRYLSTDFLIYDGKGNTSPEDYRIKKESAYMIGFHGGTTVRRSSVKADGFVRHPFDLIDFDDLQVTNNKYLIDMSQMWGSLGDVLIENKTKSAGLHAMILTSVSAKLYNMK
ncbi:hypothetical protein OROMI_024101 [Orobanche minor]